MLRLLRSLLAVAVIAPILSAQAPTTGWRGEFLATFNTATEKYLQLAEAMPQEKMTWRPGEGVRSTAEVFLHVAAANYNLASRLGATRPEGFNPQNFETSTTDKAEILRHLQASFAHFRDAVTAFPEADAEKMMRWFGPPEISSRHFLYFNADHNGEHLGQLIAYARMNGVRPPWARTGN